MARKKRQDTESDVPPVERAEGGKWAPGASPNPGGQPAWVREAREAIGKQCWGMAARMLERVLSMDTLPKDADEPTLPEVTVDHLLKAIDITAKYTLPKPVQKVEVGGPGGRPLAAVDASMLLEFVKSRKG